MEDLLLHISVRGCSNLNRSALSTSLNFMSWATAKNLLCGTLDNTTSDWETGGLLEPEINLTS
jgi:hypothetical protein